MAQTTSGSQQAHTGPDLTDQHQFMVAWRLAEPQLRVFTQRLPHHVTQADDVLQNTWLTASLHAHQYSGRGSSTGWFFRICQSVCRQALHRDKRLRCQPLVPDTYPIEDGYSESGEYRRVELEDARLALIESLSPRRREIVRARFIKGQSDDEIAAAFGCRPTTVRATIHQARDWCRARDPGARLRGKGV